MRILTQNWHETAWQGYWYAVMGKLAFPVPRNLCESRLQEKLDEMELIRAGVEPVRIFNNGPAYIWREKKREMADQEIDSHHSGGGTACSADGIQASE